MVINKRKSPKGKKQLGDIRVKELTKINLLGNVTVNDGKYKTEMYRVHWKRER